LQNFTGQVKLFFQDHRGNNLDRKLDYDPKDILHIAELNYTKMIENGL